MVRIRVSYHIFKFLVSSSSPTHKLIWYSCIMHSVKLSKQFAPASLALYLISVILSYYVWQLSWHCRLDLKIEVIIHFLFFNFLVLFLNLYYSAIDHLYIPKKKEKKRFWKFRFCRLLHVHSHIENYEITKKSYHFQDKMKEYLISFSRCPYLYWLRALKRQKVPISFNLSVVWATEPLRGSYRNKKLCGIYAIERRKK